MKPSVPTSFWILLIVGVIVRTLALTQPILDAHPIRQCQTADATRSLIQEPGWHLSSQASWMGDTGARLVQEFPAYNYLAVAAYYAVGNLDMAGKIASILLWALSFWLLQLIWRRTLEASQGFWANVLFVFSPLSVFFGQAFMPEMLIQACAFGFVAAVLRYRETQRVPDLFVCGMVGALGLVVKTPEISHLYVVAALVLMEKEGWRAVSRPRYWVWLGLTAVVVKGWSSFVNVVNQPDFPSWTATAALPEFLGTLRDRLNPTPYAKMLAYIVIFVATPLAILPTLGAIPALIRRQAPRFALYWTGSLLFFYLVWGFRTAAGHSYYNLPALGPVCLLFGIGCDAFVTWWNQQRQLSRYGWAAPVTILGGLSIFNVPASLYLFRQDKVIYESALWLKQHTPPTDLVVIKSNHRADMVDYAPLPCFSYYAGKNVWIWAPSTEARLKERARATSHYAVITHPTKVVGVLEKWRRQLKMEAAPIPLEKVDWISDASDFEAIHEVPEFTVYKRRAK